jgi:hypothetical protein
MKEMRKLLGAAIAIAALGPAYLAGCAEQPADGKGGESVVASKSTKMKVTPCDIEKEAAKCTEGGGAQ